LGLWRRICFCKAFDWSADSKKVYIRFDKSGSRIFDVHVWKDLIYNANI
jgi:hypothetical protein